MKKKEYISPKVVVKIVDYTTMIVDGSEHYKQSTDIKVNVNGDNIGVKKKKKPDVTDIDYSKHHSCGEYQYSCD